jgi:hypothetical protein
MVYYPVFSEFSAPLKVSEAHPPSHEVVSRLIPRHGMGRFFFRSWIGDSMRGMSFTSVTGSPRGRRG